VIPARSAPSWACRVLALSENGVPCFEAVECLVPVLGGSGSESRGRPSGGMPETATPAEGEGIAGGVSSHRVHGSFLGCLAFNPTYTLPKVTRLEQQTMRRSYFCSSRSVLRPVLDPDPGRETAARLSCEVDEYMVGLVRVRFRAMAGLRTPGDLRSPRSSGGPAGSSGPPTRTTGSVVSAIRVGSNSRGITPSLFTGSWKDVGRFGSPPRRTMGEHPERWTSVPP